MRLSVERLATFWPDSEPLMRMHWEEVGKRHATPFRFALERARAIDASGQSVICTARTLGGQMVGYCIWYLTENVICEGVKLATQTGWFVDPAWRGRGVGIRLFQLAMDELRKRGVEGAYPHYWVDAQDSQQIAAWFSKLGAFPVENVFYLPLGAG